MTSSNPPKVLKKSQPLPFAFEQVVGATLSGRHYSYVNIQLQLFKQPMGLQYNTKNYKK